MPKNKLLFIEIKLYFPCDICDIKLVFVHWKIKNLYETLTSSKSFLVVKESFPSCCFLFELHNESIEHLHKPTTWLKEKQ